MKYICIACHYIFDESLGDIVETIEEATQIESVEKCPACGEYDSFHGIKEEINKIENKNHPTSFEKEHTPYIQYVQKNKISHFVEVSVKNHPMGEENRITSICLYDEYEDLVFEEFIPLGGEPKVVFDINNFDEYIIVVRCSAHGLWSKHFVV